MSWSIFRRCKCFVKEKKMPKHITDDADISDEENSNEDNSDKENSNEEICSEE